MNISQKLFLASALVLGSLGLQAGAVSALPLVNIDAAIATANDAAAHVDNVGYYCNGRGRCWHRYGYRYSYRHYGYGYGYRPYGYHYYGLPGVRLGFY